MEESASYMLLRLTARPQWILLFETLLPSYLCHWFLTTASEVQQHPWSLHCTLWLLPVGCRLSSFMNKFLAATLSLSFICRHSQATPEHAWTCTQAFFCTLSAKSHVLTHTHTHVWAFYRNPFFPKHEQPEKKIPQHYLSLFLSDFPFYFSC